MGQRVLPRVDRGLLEDPLDQPVRACLAAAHPRAVRVPADLARVRGVQVRAVRAAVLARSAAADLRAARDPARGRDSFRLPSTPAEARSFGAAFPIRRGRSLSAACRLAGPVARPANSSLELYVP